MVYFILKFMLLIIIIDFLLYLVFVVYYRVKWLFINKNNDNDNNFKVNEFRLF